MCLGCVLDTLEVCAAAAESNHNLNKQKKKKKNVNVQLPAPNLAKYLPVYDRDE